MVIGLIFILSTICFFFGYCLYLTFRESNFDIINDIKYDKKGFFKCFIAIVGSLIGIYFCFVTPTSLIRNEYKHNNGTMTVVEYSLTGDSSIVTNVMLPKTTYGTITDVKFLTRLNGIRMWNSYTDVTVRLNDGRVLYKELDEERTSIKKGDGMSLTETFYPYYKMEFSFER